MKTSSAGRALIEKYEGLILQSYDDANDRVIKAGQTAKGTLTIGYGHTSAAGAPKVFAGQKITKEQADAILASDLAAVEADVNRLVKVSLNQNQYDALVSFHFNTGALGKSSLLKALNKGDFKGAADGFMLYTRGRVGGQLVQMSGLVKRRKEEVVLFNTPSKSIAPHVTVGGAVVAGGAAIAATHPHLWPFVVGGIVVVVIIAGCIYLYKRGK